MTGGSIQTLDYITITQKIGARSQSMPSRPHDGKRTPCRHFTMVCAELVVKKRYRDIRDVGIRNTLRKTHWSLFLDWYEGSDDNRSVLGGTQS
jgi:hypothetical protein